MATWAKAFTPLFKQPHKAPGNYANTGGGLTFNPSLKFKAVPKASPSSLGGLTSPPAGTFDPALEAQRRAAQRGLHDTLQDIGGERHFGETDLNQALRDIHTSAARRRQKLGIDFSRQGDKLATDFARGNERIDNQEADTRKNAGRQGEDLRTQIATISRQFGELGHRQAEGANASGVADQGTSTAAAAARARNQQAAEAPIHTAEGRLQEDLESSLQRLGISRQQLDEDHGTAESQLLQDRGIAGSQLKQDRDRERLLANRDEGRKTFELGRKEGRARREGAISNVDLLEEEIYQAQKEHPGALAKAGITPLGKKPPAPTGPALAAAAPALPPKRRKR